METFFTIDGIDDEILPNDPTTLKFYNRATAEAILRYLQANEVELANCFVVEHPVAEGVAEISCGYTIKE